MLFPNACFGVRTGRELDLLVNNGILSMVATKSMCFPSSICSSAPGAAGTFVVFYARARMEDNEVTQRTRRTHSKTQRFLCFLRFC
jgi:hypothetical protein